VQRYQDTDSGWQPFEGGHPETSLVAGRNSDGLQLHVFTEPFLAVADSGHGPGDAVIGAVRPDQDAEVLEPEPGDPHPGFDSLLAEGFEEGFPCSEGSADDKVFPLVDPFRGPLGLLGRARDGGRGRVPGVEGFPRWSGRDRAQLVVFAFQALLVP
jgi:hypothetical protein